MASRMMSLALRPLFGGQVVESCVEAAWQAGLACVGRHRRHRGSIAGSAAGAEYVQPGIGSNSFSRGEEPAV
jgi:hypothetical protein